MRLPVFQVQAQAGAVAQLIQRRLSRSNMLSFAALQPVVSSLLFGEEQTKGEAEQTDEAQGCSRFNP